MPATTTVVAIAAAVSLAGAGAAFAMSPELREYFQEGKEACKALKEAGDKDAAKECRKALHSEMKDMRKGEKGARDGPGKRGADFGAFESTDAGVEGRHVTFRPDAASASIHDYTVHGGFASTPIFDAIALADVENLSRTERGMDRGVYVAHGDGAGWIAFDAPNAAWFLLSKDGLVATLDVGDGLTVEPVLDASGATVGVRISNGEHTAAIRGRGNVTYEVLGDLVTVTLGEESGLGFAVEGYPRLLDQEKRVVKHIVHEAQERDADDAAP